MSGKNPRLSPRELRKRLLIVESEINRIQLAGDMSALITDVRALTHRARSFGSIASMAMVLVKGFLAYRGAKSAAAEAKSSWMQAILKFAGLA